MPLKPGLSDGVRSDPKFSTPQSRYEGNQKRWIKRYRTEVAAGMSSILSTFAAVRPRVRHVDLIEIDICLVSSR